MPPDLKLRRLAAVTWHLKKELDVECGLGPYHQDELPALMRAVLDALEPMVEDRPEFADLHQRGEALLQGGPEAYAWVAELFALLPPELASEAAPRAADGWAEAAEHAVKDRPTSGL